jgi:hypothetical protein
VVLDAGLHLTAVWDLECNLCIMYFNFGKKSAI